MKTLISLGDIDETVYKIKKAGLAALIPRLLPGKKTRIKSAWNGASEKQRTAWWEIPLIQDYWNRIITGDKDKHYSQYLNENYFGKNSVILSPGCGTGDKELRIAQLSNVGELDAFDIAEKRIEKAKKSALNRNIENINFFVADIYNFSPERERYDAVIFDSFLHHVENIGEVLERFSAGLKIGGLLVINEYVGANRFQWSDEQLKAANDLLAEIPEKYRTREFDGKVKSKIYRPGIIRMILSDPSEAVNSESILKEIRARFETIEEKPYGGNLLQLVLKDISHHFVKENEETQNLLTEIIRKEERYLTYRKSDFIFGIYKKRT